MAWTVFNSATLQEIFFSNPWITLALFVGQIALVVALSAAISKLSPAVATLIFFAYAALTGVVFSSIFLAYTGTSIASTFVATAGMFGVMSIVGLTTGMDLTKVGNILTLRTLKPFIVWTAVGLLYDLTAKLVAYAGGRFEKRLRAHTAWKGL